MVSNNHKKYHKKYHKKISLKSLLLIATITVIGCQPPEPIAQTPVDERQPVADRPIIIDDNTVTLSPDHILSIKPSRYQPSLGLQGNIEAIKQAQIKANQILVVQQVLVEPNQWVETGTPLFIVERQNTIAKTNLATNNSSTKDLDQNTTPANTTPAKQSNAQPTTKAAIDADATRPSAPKIATLSDELGSDKPTPIADTDPNNKNLQVENPLASKANPSPFITLKAPFAGRVNKLSIQDKQLLDINAPMLSLSNNNDLYFVASLPIQAKPQLSVGQTVNFTTASLSDKFTGQVSKLTASTDNKLLVTVHVIYTEANRGKLKPNMAVSGRVDYGQIEVGTIVPKSAIHDVDLSALAKAPFRPMTTLTANVWIIQQDQRLTRQPVEVIEYDPDTDRYLIAGINNDSLICLAQLPLQSAGKKVIVS